VDVIFQAGAESVIVSYRHRLLQLLVEGAPHILTHRITIALVQPLHTGPKTPTANNLPIIAIVITITSIIANTTIRHALIHRSPQPTKLLYRR
jgi:hypothetical protein